MARRWMVCSLCDGTRKWGPHGDRCVDCAGLGGSYFGEDQTPEEIEDHLRSCREALTADEAEVAKVAAALVEAEIALMGTENDDQRPLDRVNLLRKQLDSSEDGVRYWRAMIDVDEDQLSRLRGGHGRG